MALPSADALFGGQSSAQKPKADDLFGASAPASKPKADDLFGASAAPTPRNRHVLDQAGGLSRADTPKQGAAPAPTDDPTYQRITAEIAAERKNPALIPGRIGRNVSDAYHQGHVEYDAAIKAKREALKRGDYLGAAKQFGKQALGAFGSLTSPTAAFSTPVWESMYKREIDAGRTPQQAREFADVFTNDLMTGETARASLHSVEVAGRAVEAPKPRAAEPARPAVGKPAAAKTGFDPATAKPARGVHLDETKTGPVYERGKKVETPEQSAQRVDDALHRLKNSATADKLELQEFLRRLPAEHQDPKLQEELYHAIEQKLVDPKAEIPDHLKPAFEAMQSLYKEQTDLANEIRARGGGDPEAYGYDQGYVHRIAKGRGSFFDANDTEGAGRTDPITGKRSLAKTTGSLKSRKFAVIVDPETGKRTFVEGDEYVPGTKVPGSFGKEFDVKHATTAEIEANTDVRYHKNALLSTVDNVARLRRVKRNLDVLDSLVTDAKARNLAERTEWHYQNDRGEWVRAQSNADPVKLREKGFRETTIPQLKGVWFDKRIADTLEDFYGKDKGDLDSLLTKANRLLSSSLFITPVPHALNVLGHWAVGRGWDWLNPYAYARAARYGTRAVKEVLSGGPEYRAMLREGSGLMFGDIATENFHKVLLEKMAGEIADDPQLDQAARGFGLKNAAELGKAVYDAIYKTSNRALWAANDIFLLQRQYELMDKGMSAREAIHEAERDIPNYRIPPQVMGQRWLTEALRSPNYMLFGRYKYGMFKAYGAMFRDMFRGTPKERFDAVGKFVALIALATAALPFADSVVQQATGNKDARVHRFGPLSVPQAVADWTQGQRDWAGMLASVITPAPATETFLEGLFNRNLFTGRHVVEPQGTPLGKATQAGEWAADKFYPTSLAADALRQRGPLEAAERLAGKMVGVEVPPEDRKAKQARGKRFERNMARGREKRDPIERMIRGLE